jgi:protease-4
MKTFARSWIGAAVVVLAIAPWALAAPKAKAKDKSTPKGESKAVVAVFSLDKPITEAPQQEDFPLFGNSGGESLKEVVARLKKARDDKDVKAVVFLFDSPGFSLSQAEELRRAMAELKAAGKEILVHVDSLTTRGYLLAAGASKIAMEPTGILLVYGFNAESPYLRGLLDRLGVVPDFLTCGAYKSAGEMFMRASPSPQAKQMENWLLDSLYASATGMIAQGRRVPEAKAREWIDTGLFTAEKALRSGIIDRVQSREEFTADLKRKFGAQVKFDKKYGKAGRGAELDFSSPLGVFKLWAELFQGLKKPESGKDALAIIYVDGPILPGKGSSSPMGSIEAAYSTPIRKALDKAAADKSIKGVLLRVSSPGGSATASEIILNASRRLAAKKPLVVSMGSVAGSGGYYVSMGAGTIFADATTITASIGVVSGKFATTRMWNKIGVSWDINRRGRSAGLLSSDQTFSAAERQKMQAFMDEIYGVFKAHVVANRGKKLKKPIDELAGGRVFTGKQALELGLVDRLGSLEDALRCLAKQAKLTDYEVRVLPKPKNFLEVLMEDMADEDSDSDTDRIELRTSFAGPQLPSILRMALPLLGSLEPGRLEAVRAALGRLDLLGRERAVLIMPEIRIAD